jgi:hypothetical protein
MPLEYQPRGSGAVLVQTVNLLQEIAPERSPRQNLGVAVEDEQVCHESDVGLAKT